MFTNGKRILSKVSRQSSTKPTGFATVETTTTTTTTNREKPVSDATPDGKQSRKSTIVEAVPDYKPTAIDTETPARDETSELLQSALKAQDQLHEDLRTEKQRRRDVESALDKRSHELCESENKVRSLEQKLASATDRIFSLQPRRVEFTDAEAEEQFRNLVKSVDRWVKNRMDFVLQVLDDRRLNEHRLPADQGRWVLEHVSGSAKRWLPAAQADEMHVTAIVMEFLRQMIFNKSFYCPLGDASQNDNTIQLLDRISADMAELPREKVQCREWRCEALAAITRQPDFKDYQAQFIFHVTKSLTSLLMSLILPRESELANFEASIRTSIVQPAVTLAHHLHLALKEYEIGWPQLYNDGSPDLTKCDCADLSKRGKQAVITRANGEAANYVYMFSVFPGLYVADAADDAGTASWKIICRPQALVYHQDRGPILQQPTVMTWIDSQARRVEPPPRQSQ